MILRDHCDPSWMAVIMSDPSCTTCEHVWSQYFSSYGSCRIINEHQTFDDKWKPTIFCDPSWSLMILQDHEWSFKSLLCPVYIDLFARSPLCLGNRINKKIYHPLPPLWTIISCLLSFHCLNARNVCNANATRLSLAPLNSIQQQGPPQRHAVVTIPGGNISCRLCWWGMVLALNPIVGGIILWYSFQ